MSWKLVNCCWYIPRSDSNNRAARFRRKYKKEFDQITEIKIKIAYLRIERQSILRSLKKKYPFFK